MGTGRVRRPRSSDGSLWRVIRTIKATSKREVKAALAELEAAVAAGKVSLDDMTFAELLERCMEHIAGLGRADTTLYHYRQYIEREIGPVLPKGNPFVEAQDPRHRPVVHESGKAVGARAAKCRQARLGRVTAAARAAPA